MKSIVLLFCLLVAVLSSSVQNGNATLKSLEVAQFDLEYLEDQLSSIAEQGLSPSATIAGDNRFLSTLQSYLKNSVSLARDLSSISELITHVQGEEGPPSVCFITTASSLQENLLETQYFTELLSATRLSFSTTVYTLDEAETQDQKSFIRIPSLPFALTTPWKGLADSYTVFHFLANQPELKCDILHFPDARGLAYYSALSYRQGHSLQNVSAIVLGSASLEASPCSAITADCFGQLYMEEQSRMLSDFFWDLESDTQPITVSVTKPTNTQSSTSVSSTPLVSVCVIHHERPEFLAELVQSLKEQTYTNFEVVLVDDFSTSVPSLELLANLEETGWIRVIRNPENLFLGASRNIAAQNARGEFLLFLDDDNLLEPHSISEFVEVAQRRQLDVITTAQSIFYQYEEDQPKEDEVFVPLGNAPLLGLFWNCFGDGNAFFRASTFQGVLGGFTEESNVGGEDYELFVTASLNPSEVKLEVIPLPLIRYRLHDSSEQMHLSTDPLMTTLRAARPYLALFTMLNDINPEKDTQRFLGFLYQIRFDIRQYLAVVKTSEDWESQQNHTSLTRRGILSDYGGGCDPCSGLCCSNLCVPNDNLNCGACGIVCGSGTSCDGSSCVPVQSPSKSKSKSVSRSPSKHSPSRTPSKHSPSRTPSKHTPSRTPSKHSPSRTHTPSRTPTKHSPSHSRTRTHTHTPAKVSPTHSRTRSRSKSKSRTHSRTATRSRTHSKSRSKSRSRSRSRTRSRTPSRSRTPKK